MEHNIFSILSKKIVATVIAIGSMFYSTISGVNARFEEINLRTKGNYLVISTRLIHCFSEDLDLIFSSGREVKIHFLIQIFENGKNDPAYETSFYHLVKYSLIDQIYSVYQSEKDEIIEGLSLDEAKTFLSVIEKYPVISSNQLSHGYQYTVKLTAYMGKMHLPGMEEETNLMFYWSSLKPSITSEPFTKDIFEQ